MQLKFVPVEAFYFALTLCVKSLEELDDPEFLATVHKALQEQFGQSSTVAAAKQNNFNYVFQVLDIDNSPSPQLVVSVADWNGKLRLASDFGWTLDSDRKPTRTDHFTRRAVFAEQLKVQFSQILNISFPLSESVSGKP